jgi:hypothetical protein
VKSIAAVLLVLLLWILPGPLQGQQPPDSVAAAPLPPAPAVSAGDSVPVPREITPRGALIRSLLVPGWGHAVTGSYTRAGFYLTAQAGNVWMLAKTGGHLSWAGRVERAVEAETEARLAGQGVPRDSIPARVRADPGVIQARNLVEARRSQREDWIALGLFFILIGGVDAFVSAHLQDFPEPLTVEPVGVPGGGFGLEVGVRIPWRGPGRQ